jgi:hypothetical protein
MVLIILLLLLLLCPFGRLMMLSWQIICSDTRYVFSVLTLVAMLRAVADKLLSRRRLLASKILCKTGPPDSAPSQRPGSDKRWLLLCGCIKVIVDNRANEPPLAAVRGFLLMSCSAAWMFHQFLLEGKIWCQ